MSELFDNAIHSIKLGIEDYQSSDDRRPISALRNFYAGVLLLGKECLLQAAPNADPMQVLASRYVPGLDDDGNLLIGPKGQTTIDLQELRERFGTFGLKWPDGNIKELQKLRNDFEHFHSKAPKESIRQAIAACFPLVVGFFAILEIGPASALGTTWDVMLAEKAFFEKQKRECDATLEKLPWWDHVWDSSHFQCTACSSSLIYQEDTGNSDPAMVRGRCKACDQEYSEEETTEMIVQSLFGADDYIAAKDGGEQVINHCPECSVEAYVESSEFTGCFFCDYSINDECARCSAALTVATQSVNNPHLCDYCDHVSSRAD
ncbi:hypothetical protein GOB25_19200 [Sinorhizobium meliloti]|nr:hypothetical protein [Sinorhizobium meliloti]